MIDINELRRLAQAATPGPWWVNRDGLNHGFARGVVEINANDWHALAGTWAVNGAKHSDEGVANAEFIAAANPATINELLDRLEAAEKAVTESCQRGYATGQEEVAAELEFAKREVANLHDDIHELTDERDALRAKIEAMEKQEPYSYIYEYANPIDGSPVWRDTPGYWNAQYPRSSKPLYALPGAKGE